MVAAFPKADASKRAGRRGGMERSNLVTESGPIPLQSVDRRRRIDVQWPRPRAPIARSWSACRLDPRAGAVETLAVVKRPARAAHYQHAAWPFDLGSRWPAYDIVGG